MKKLCIGLLLIIVAIPLILGYEMPEMSTVVTEEVEFVIPVWVGIAFMVFVVIIFAMGTSFLVDLLKIYKNAKERDKASLAVAILSAASHCTGIVVGFLYYINFANLILSGVIGIVVIELTSYLLLGKPLILSLCKYYKDKPDEFWHRS